MTNRHMRPVLFLLSDSQHPLAKTKKSQHPAAQRAATDNWVHDANGEPLLVVTSEMNEGLTQVLEPILTEVKQLVGDRRPIVIFDRGGWSPKGRDCHAAVRRRFGRGWPVLAGCGIR